MFKLLTRTDVKCIGILILTLCCHPSSRISAESTQQSQPISNQLHLPCITLRCFDIHRIGIMLFKIVFVRLHVVRAQNKIIILIQYYIFRTKCVTYWFHGKSSMLLLFSRFLAFLLSRFSACSTHFSVDNNEALATLSVSHAYRPRENSSFRTSQKYRIAGKGTEKKINGKQSNENHTKQGGRTDNRTNPTE